MFYTSRLMLRAVDLKTDLNTITHWLNDADFLASMRGEAARPSNRETTQKWIEHATSDSDGLPCFMICERPADGAGPETLDADEDLFVLDGKARYPTIGILRFHHSEFKFENRVVRLGVALDAKHRDKGLGSEVMRWACEYCFDSLSLHRLELWSAAENDRAIKVYEKIGFVREGVARQSYFQHGRWKDLVHMGLLADEWRATTYINGKPPQRNLGFLGKSFPEPTP